MIRSEPALASTGRISRCRTGCLTCRRRRKKCDERKPTCRNCERNSLACEGYQQRVQWLPPQRKPKEKRKRRAEVDIEAPVAGRSGHEQEQDEAQSSSPGGKSPLPSSDMTTKVMPASPQIIKTRGYIPLPSQYLPPLINGVESALERRLFIHFGSIMAPTLVLNGVGTHNPFTDAIMQLALRHTEIMRLTFGIAACHILRVLEKSGADLGTADIKQLGRTKLELYGEAIRFHARTMDPFLSRSAIVPSRDQAKLAFATTMLLCQFDTCEGGSAGIWRTHLSAAQELLQQTKRVFTETLADDPGYQLLQDWYQYHEGISQLFDVSKPDSELSPVCLNGEFSPPDVTFEARDAYILIGTRDGLLRLMTQVANLRRRSQLLARPQAQCDQSAPGAKAYAGTHTDALADIQLLTLGMEIDTELHSWHFDYRTEQHHLLGECYRWAIFIILCSTVHTDRYVTDEKIQCCLHGGLAWLGSLSASDNAQTCCLFPVFVFGIAAVEPQARQAVKAKINNYQLWSGLGNADETARFLLSWWEYRDVEGWDVNWWEWQNLAAKMNMTVTLV